MKIQTNIGALGTVDAPLSQSDAKARLTEIQDELDGIKGQLGKQGQRTRLWKERDGLLDRLIEIRDEAAEA